MGALVRSASLSNYAEVARAVGLNPLHQLRRAKLDQRCLSDPDLRVPARAVVELLEYSSDKSGVENFGLRMAERRQISHLGVVSLLVGREPTLRHALATLAKYRYLVNESLAIHIEQTGDLVILRESLEIETPRSLRQAHELAIGALCVLIRGFLGSRWLPVSVSFMHAAPKDMRIHRRLLGPAIAFNSDFNGIVCLAADMDKPNPGADPTLARYAKKLLANLPNMAAESVVREVRKSIYLFLPLGGSSIARVAEGLGLTVRTLQRRLDSERVEFSDLVRSVRRDLAVRYLLNSSDPITKIADNLGYSQTSSFTRWFHTEFGSSPVKWRSDERLRRSRKRKRNVSKSLP